MPGIFFISTTIFNTTYCGGKKKKKNQKKKKTHVMQTWWKLSYKRLKKENFVHPDFAMNGKEKAYSY